MRFFNKIFLFICKIIDLSDIRCTYESETPTILPSPAGKGDRRRAVDEEDIFAFFVIQKAK